MKSVIFIDRAGISYYGGNVHTVISFPFTPEIVDDLEIVNEKDFKIKYSEWLKSHSVEAGPVGIVFASDFVFQKEIPVVTPLDQREILKKEFLDHVPFNEVVISEHQLPKSTLVVAGNMAFAHTLQEILHEKNFVVESIAPVAAIYGAQQVRNMDVRIAQEIIGKSSVMSAAAFISTKQVDVSQTEDEFDQNETPSATKKNMRLYILLGALGISVVALVVVYFMFMAPTPRITTSTLKPPVMQASVSPTAALVASESAQIATTGGVLVEKSNTAPSEVKIQVLNGSGIAGQADAVRVRLETAGFAKVSTGNAPTTLSEKVLVVFSSSVSDVERQKIMAVLDAFFTATTVQTRSDIDSDVIITTSSGVKSTTP